MPITEAHPSALELAAFTLGTLDDEAQASIETHVAACTSCQEHAAVAPGDSLVELLRRVDARADRGADTVVVSPAQVETPTPLAAVAETEGLAPAVALCVSAESGRPRVPDAVPAELARHKRYLVLRLLGAGGMGAVYEAEHRVMRRRVAVKIIRRDYTANPNALERFRGEVENAARLSHPNIVTTYDAEDAGETLFLVMEYVEGTDLGRLVQEQGPLGVDRACDYVRQAALGLQYAFEQGMVHRDLKPHNLMLTPDGRVKILDFGLAHFASEAAPAACRTGTGVVLGTVDYIAPEQADNAHQADIRSDIYSLGCTLYHLLAGQPPFPTGTPIQKVMAHVEKKPQPLTELRQDIPEGVMPVIDRMMAKKPKRRYQKPIEVANALERFTSPRVPKTDYSRTLVLPKPPAPSRRRIVALVAALLFIVAGLLGGAVYRIATDKGELVITTESDDVKVVITQSGKLVDVIDTKSDKQIRLALRSGEYELELEGAPKGLNLDIKSAKLTRGKTVLAAIKWGGEPDDPLPVLPPPKKPLDGVVAWWRADGNAKDSAGDNNGALKGGVKFAPGVAGQAFDFNGKDAYIHVLDNAKLNPGAAFSVEFWVKANPSQPEAYFLVVDKSHGFVDDTGWHFQGLTATGELGFGMNAAPGGRGDEADTGVSILDNQWHHIAGVFTGDSIQIYLDGLLKCMKPFKGLPANNTRDLYFGSGYTSATRRYNGLLDEVAIYDRALSPEEVKARWSALAPATKAVAEKVGLVRQFNGHTQEVKGIAFFKDGRRIVSVSADQTIRVCDVDTGKELQRLELHTDRCCDNVALCPDQRHVLSGGVDNTVRLWDLETSKELSCFRGNGRICGLAVSPDGSWALSGSHDGTVRLHDMKDLNKVHVFAGHTRQVENVAISSNGHLAASAGIADGTVRLWDLDKREEIACLQAHGGGVWSVAFSPDGKRLLSAGRDNVLRLWDVNDHKQLQVFEGHRDGYYCVAFSPDGRRVLSSGSDGTLHLWDVNTAKELHRFTGHRGQVWRVTFSPDGRLALSCGVDHTIRLWRLPDPQSAKENP